MFVVGMETVVSIDISLLCIRAEELSARSSGTVQTLRPDRMPSKQQSSVLCQHGFQRSSHDADA